MHRIVSLFVLMFLVGAASAQEMPQLEPIYRVQYTVETSVQPESEAAFSHPAIEALSQQERLGTLDVSAQGAQRLQVKATFGFGSMADFQNWYAADETRALLRLLGEHAEARAHLAVQRVQ